MLAVDPSEPSPDHMLRQSHLHLPCRLLMIAIVGLALAGCGQKGDLYLPDRGRTQAAPAAFG
jgi:hypothetical protein